ncbi:MAG TPA: hypothetical protein PLV41_12025 [Miltoncostaeales bacterium]|nr:hypothetical protein [Miltoncostaeales bacterium]
MSESSVGSGVASSIGVRYYEACDGLDLESGSAVVLLQVIDDNGTEKVYSMLPDKAATMAVHLLAAAETVQAQIDGR